MCRWKQSCGLKRATVATFLFASLIVPTTFAQMLPKVEGNEGRLGVMDENTALSEILRRAVEGVQEKEVPLALRGEQGDRLAAFREILAKGGPEAEQALFGAALDPDPSIREWASETLAARNSQEGFKTILKAATAKDAVTRLMALQVLSQHETFALPALAKALSDQDMEVKRYAMQMLAEKGSPNALKALGQVLLDPNPAFRQYALQFFSQLGDPTSLYYIRLALHDQDEAVRGLAADLLSRQ